MRGHIAPRLASNRRCVTCAQESAATWKADNEGHMKAYRKNVYAANRDEALARWSEWYEENREEQLEKKKARYAENRDGALEYAKNYRKEEPEKVKAASKKWRDENPEKRKEAWQRWYAENGKERDAKRRATPRGKIDGVMSRSIYNSLKDAKAGRTWESLVGYTITDLMAHLEKQFVPGMEWDNYGPFGWHVDHKIPRSAFNYSDPSHIDFKRCWSLSNLQPLWWRDNLSKGDKLASSFQPSLAIAA